MPLTDTDMSAEPLPSSPPGADLVFHVEGSLVVSGVEDTRARMVAHFAGTPGVMIDLGGATDFDLFGLQLICAARRSAEAAGKPFELRNVPEAFLRACDLAALTAASFASLPHEYT